MNQGFDQRFCHNSPKYALFQVRLRRAYGSPAHRNVLAAIEHDIRPGIG